MRRTEAENFDHLSPKELLTRGIVTERIEHVSLANILRGEDLYDERRAETLAKSMMGPKGQLDSALLRARLNDAREVVCDIINGQHRYEGMKLVELWKNEPQFFFSNVMYGCTDEEYWNLKVLAVHSTKSVKFARMAIIMKKAFLSTSWNDPELKDRIANEEISLAQVFTISNFDTSGKKLGLSASQAEELKGWAKSRASEWDRPLGTLRNDMQKIEVANPDVVKMVRAPIGKKSGEYLFTYGKLKKLLKIFPGEWELQLSIANTTINNKLAIKDLETLLDYCLYCKQANDQSTLDKLLHDPSFLSSSLMPITASKSRDLPQETKSREKRTKKTINKKTPRPQKTDVVQPSQKTKEEKPISTRTKQKLLTPNHKIEPYNEKHYRDRSAEGVLRKHGVPRLFSACKEIVIRERGKKIIILNMPKSQLILDTKDESLSYKNKKIMLSPFERDLMFAFYLFKGIPLSTSFLSTLHNSNNKFQRINVHESVVSLRKKIFELYPPAAKELSFERNKFSWLAE